MRNMSFSKTTQQIYARTKTVTRRFGWWFLKPGDRLQAVEKCQGLKKGEHVKKICVIEIVSTREEFVWDVTYPECVREGFPDLSVSAFIEVLLAGTKENRYSIVNRVEFKYVD